MRDRWGEPREGRAPIFFFFNKESERTSYAIIQPQVQFKRYKLRAHANSVKHYLEF